MRLSLVLAVIHFELLLLGSTQKKRHIQCDVFLYFLESQRPSTGRMALQA